MILQEFRGHAYGKHVYIWGTRIAGLSALPIIEANGIHVEAFIDSIPCSEKKLGKEVISAEEFLQFPINSFVIICTRGHSPHIAARLSERNIPYITWEELQKFDYYIEVNNKCNLNCITCSVREYYNKPLHNMSIEDFKKVLLKIRKEDPFASWVNLYGHNEPLLSSTLPDMIRISNTMGFAVGISTNLAMAKDFEDVVKAKPTFIRVSLSGWGSTYEKIHQNGAFPLLFTNLYKLNIYRSQHCPEMMVEVFFHRYKGNSEDEIKVRDLCTELNFEFRVIDASVIAFETVSNILDGRPVSRKIQDALPLLIHSVEETAAMAYLQRGISCPNDHMVRIHSDLTIAGCLAWMGSVIPDTNFLQISYKDLEEKLVNTPYCRFCKPRGLHQFCEIVFDEERV